MARTSQAYESCVRGMVPTGAQEMRSFSGWHCSLTNLIRVRQVTGHRGKAGAGLGERGRGRGSHGPASQFSVRTSQSEPGIAGGSSLARPGGPNQALAGWPGLGTPARWRRFIARGRGLGADPFCLILSDSSGLKCRRQPDRQKRAGSDRAVESGRPPGYVLRDEGT